MSFKERLREHAGMIEKRLEELLTPTESSGGYTVSEHLYEAMCYSALGGKRLRGFLALQFCLGFGGKAENALDYACAVEMMHAFSLIHDDLPAMDDDDMRRGKLSCHKRFGEATAILAGDALAIDALRTAAFNKKCSPAQNNDAVCCLSCFAGGHGMCSGQQLDLDGEGKELTESEISLIIERKTGDMFSAACYMGMVAASESPLAESQAATAIGFGRELGFAFQITDDLLDIRSTSEAMGKTVGKDEKADKSTLPALLGIDGAEKKAEYHVEKAKRCLDALPPCVYRDELNEMIDYVLTRKN